MSKAKTGDRVKVHYTGTLDDGTVFDTTKGGEPLEFVLGSGEIISAFEENIIGMEEGEKKNFVIKAEDAYGPHRDELVLEVSKDDFPPDIHPKEGQQLQLTQPDGHSFVVTVKEVKENTVVLDANHPLAGKDLNFEVELVEIEQSEDS